MEKKIIIMLGTIVLMGGVALLCAFPTMWLWNWLMPAIFGIKVITFWQALGINILSSILFTGRTIHTVT